MTRPVQAHALGNRSALFSGCGWFDDDVGSAGRRIAPDARAVVNYCKGVVRPIPTIQAADAGRFLPGSAADGEEVLVLTLRSATRMTWDV